ncbi:MAG TPA: PHB depolymerase family esterase [Burkholderiales bacterium]|jgi:poly(3-hydroxybutyrate) depolymerase
MRFCSATGRLAIALISLHAWAAPPLPRLDAEASATVSGLSSGAYMAVQVHVAHSSMIKGAGALAGGPYYCAQGSLWTAYYNCMKPGSFMPLPSLATLKTATDRLASDGRIDPTANLASGRAWLFTGTRDDTVARQVVEALQAFYGAYKTASVLVGDKPAGHAMVTEDAGNKDCGVTRSPFINDCHYDAAGALLQYLAGPLAPPAASPAGRLQTFDQKPFGGYDISMGDEGYVYIPKDCETQRCRVHVAFHGCLQGKDAVDDTFAREAGYNRWADTNRIIVLYPQATARWWWVYNPNGCWDWWGYTGAQYHTKDGAQIRAVMAMLKRLGESRQ